MAHAPAVTVWGTGTPRREFLCSDDLADACVFVMKHYSDYGFLNVGTGEDVTIAEFAEAVREIVGYQGRIVFDTARPDGPLQKLLDISKLKTLGWAPKISLRDGLARAYADFLAVADVSRPDGRPISSIRTDVTIQQTRAGMK